MALRSITTDNILKVTNKQNDTTDFRSDEKLIIKQRRRYTEEEDAIILKRVKKMGYENPETWIVLAKDLDRKNPLDIKKRYDLIISRESKTMKRYTEQDDRYIIKF